MNATHIAGELLLAATTAVSLAWLWRSGRRACAFGLSFVAGAALLGALEYAGAAAVSPMHASATRWAAVAGFPAFAGFALWTQGHREPSWPIIAAVVLALGLIGRISPGPDYALAIGSLALLCLLALAAFGWKATPRNSALLFLACAVTALAGLLIGTEGDWRSISRVDLYHLALASANLAYGRALRGITASSYMR